jgi:hypothetical protein
MGDRNRNEKTEKIIKVFDEEELKEKKKSRKKRSKDQNSKKNELIIVEKKFNIDI